MIITWSAKTVSISQLKPWEKNPRKISDVQYNQLKASLQQDGYHQRILATPDLKIIGGHQRIKALKELGFDQIEILVPNQKISSDEYRRIALRDNLFYGEFDFDIIEDVYTNDELIDWGMPESLLDIVQETVQANDGEEKISKMGEFLLLVECRDEENQQKLYKKIQSEGFTCKILN